VTGTSLLACRAGPGNALVAAGGVAGVGLGLQQAGTTAVSGRDAAGPRLVEEPGPVFGLLVFLRVLLAGFVPGLGAGGVGGLADAAPPLLVLVGELGGGYRLTGGNTGGPVRDCR
jgi:hypothetical protein